MSGLFAHDATLKPIALPDAEVWFLRSLDLGMPADEVLHRLVAECEWRSETIRMFDKVYLQPRLIAWYGDAGAGYRYSGKLWEPNAWTPLLADLRGRVEAATGERFDSVLANYYRDERDSVAMHADDERELGPEPVIASLSVGETRRFVMRHRLDRTQKTRRFDLESGSLLVMKGPTQRFWQHGVPKETTPRGPRVNLTFRRILR